MSEDELIVALKEAIGTTVHGIAKAARIWVEMERRGLDLSNYRKSLHAYLPLVAQGKLLPETVVEFMGDVRILQRFAVIPRDQQRQLLQKGTIPVYDVRRQTVRQVPLAQLDADQAELAIDEKAGALRSPEQQKERAAIRPVAKKAAQKESPAQTMHLIVERSLGAKVRLAAEAESMTVTQYLAENLTLPTMTKKK